MELTGEFDEEYTTLFERGKGNHGRVIMCENNINGCLRSAKIVDKDKINPDLDVLIL